MNPALVDAIAKTVLYEGYLLYPYRPSAVKNRQRFNFGVVYPRSFSEAQGGSDAWSMQTECLVLADQGTQCAVRVRFLRIVERTIGRFAAPPTNLTTLNIEGVQIVDRLEVNGKSYLPWQEAIEEEIEVPECGFLALAAQEVQWPFRLSRELEVEAIKDEAGRTLGIILREQHALAGMIELSAKHLQDGLFRLTVRLSNPTWLENPKQLTREDALAHSLVSAHSVLEARGGEFISLIDPPTQYSGAAKACNNVGTWPVLVGEEGQRDTMLSSPIILYDYPRVAPESPGDLFDGAEIDEILSLRIMTMTDEEKLEMRQSDERARKILERTETLPQEQFMKLHGALRGLRSVSGETP